MLLNPVVVVSLWYGVICWIKGMVIDQHESKHTLQAPHVLGFEEEGSWHFHARQRLECLQQFWQCVRCGMNPRGRVGVACRTARHASQVITCIVYWLMLCPQEVLGLELSLLTLLRMQQLIAPLMPKQRLYGKNKMATASLGRQPASVNMPH